VFIVRGYTHNLQVDKLTQVQDTKILINIFTEEQKYIKKLSRCEFMFFNEQNIDFYC